MVSHPIVLNQTIQCVPTRTLLAFACGPVGEVLLQKDDFLSTHGHIDTQEECNGRWCEMERGSGVLWTASRAGGAAS